MIRSIVVVGCTVWLLGCASNVPQAIRAAPDSSVQVPDVQRDAARFAGTRVRWGGTIIGVANLERATEIEILAYPLDDRGEPREDAAAEGRFIARAAGFLDPALFPKDRQLTVAGRIETVETRPVGEYPYRFPIVAAETRYLWPEPPPPVPFYRDPWYDPWYGPWYRPWGPWGGPW